MGNRLYKKTDTEVVTITVSLGGTYHVFEESPNMPVRDILGELGIHTIRKKFCSSFYIATVKNKSVKVSITNSQEERVDPNEEIKLYKNRIIFVDIYDLSLSE